MVPLVAYCFFLSKAVKAEQSNMQFCVLGNLVCCCASIIGNNGTSANKTNKLSMYIERIEETHNSFPY